MANNHNDDDDDNNILPMGFNYGIDYRVGPRPALREITKVLPACPPAISIPREQQAPRRVRMFWADEQRWNAILETLRYT